MEPIEQFRVVFMSLYYRNSLNKGIYSILNKVKVGWEDLKNEQIYMNKSQ